MDFNPLDDEIIEPKFEEPKYITIWLEQIGRKKNTFCVNWNIKDDELKEHLSKIKKINGCGGSIKKLENDNGKSVNGIHIQGDLVEFMKSYLIKQGVDSKLINIRGVQH